MMRIIRRRLNTKSQRRQNHENMRKTPRAQLTRAPGLLASLGPRERAVTESRHWRESAQRTRLFVNLDRFHYAYDDARWGDPTSPVRLSPQVEGSPPPLAGRLNVVARAGCDQLPVDIAREDQRLRLKAYLWPDQPYRLERLEAAMAVANAHPFQLTKEDAADFVDRELADRPNETAYVLMHSIMWQYMPDATKARIEAALARHGDDATQTAPIAHLRMEPTPGESGHALLSLTMWPGGTTRRLARVDFHGRWIAWEK